MTARARVVERAKVVLPPWLLARAFVLGTLALTRHVLTELHVAPYPVQAHQGLLAWDAAFYADIARGGYHAVPDAGLRFFPLVPLLGRALGWLPGVDSDLGLLIVVNASALALGFVLYELVVREVGDTDIARRAVWLAALAPPAFVLVLGYAEATLMLLGVAVALLVRRKQWWAAAGAGYLAGLSRPVGVFLAVFVLVEVATALRAARGRERVAQIAALVAPPAGLFTYLLWVADRTDRGFFYALRIQENPRLRGETVNPITNLGHATSELFSGDRFGSGLHAVTALVLVVLLVVLVRKWPWSYTAYAAVTLAFALSASNLDSLERYAFSTFPFVLAAATAVRTSWERVAWVLCGAGIVGACVLAFTGVMVP
jgi:hypothetical protein